MSANTVRTEAVFRVDVRVQSAASALEEEVDGVWEVAASPDQPAKKASRSSDRASSDPIAEKAAMRAPMDADSRSLMELPWLLDSASRLNKKAMTTLRMVGRSCLARIWCPK